MTAEEDYQNQPDWDTKVEYRLDALEEENRLLKLRLRAVEELLIERKHSLGPKGYSFDVYRAAPNAPKDSWGSPELSSMESDDPLVWTQYPTYDDD